MEKLLFPTNLRVMIYFGGYPTQGDTISQRLLIFPACCPAVMEKWKKTPE